MNLLANLAKQHAIKESQLGYFFTIENLFDYSKALFYLQ